MAVVAPENDEVLAPKGGGEVVGAGGGQLTGLLLRGELAAVKEQELMRVLGKVMITYRLERPPQR